MKIAFVNLNSKYIHSSLAPWYLSAAVNNMKEPGVEVVVIEVTINESDDSIIKRIEEAKADYLGFCCYIWNIKKIEMIGALVAERSKAVKIFFGGPEVSYRPVDVLERYPFVESVICGEGEWPVTEFIRAVIDGKSMRNIAGICGRENGKIFVNEAYISTELPPDPYSEEYFKSLNGRIAYFESSRGCPFSCAFCLSGRCGRVRFFPFEEATKRLVSLANSGTRTIKFVDRTFNAHHDRTNMWLRFLLEERGKSIPENVCFHFEVAGDLLKEDTLELLKGLPVGMVQLEIGLQSFDPHTLEAVTRKTDTLRLKENIRQLLSFENMHIHLDLIMGLPSEDMEKVRKSFNEAFNLRPHMLQVGFLKLLYGAAMRENTEAFPCEYSKEAPYEVISTPWLSEDELKALHSMEDAVERIYNSGRLIKTLDYVLEASGMESFDFFMLIGENMRDKVKAGMSFNEYEEVLAKVLLSLENIDGQILRDYMVIDRLETDASGRIPSFLRIEDEKLKTVRKLLNKEESTKAISGVKRGMAIVYTQNKAAYVDYINKNPITGRFEINYVDL